MSHPAARPLSVTWSAACVVGILLQPSATSTAAAQSDDTVGMAVAAAVRQCAHLTIFDHVSSRAQNGLVVLEGKVTAPGKRKDIEARVSAVAGVQEIRNEIAVLPVSQADDGLRYRVSRAIYGNPSFWSYAAMPHPPIHIIVENGHVTLLGTVSTKQERAIVRSLATGHGERSISNQLGTSR